MERKHYGWLLRKAHDGEKRRRFTAVYLQQIDLLAYKIEYNWKYILRTTVQLLIKTLTLGMDYTRKRNGTREGDMNSIISNDKIFF